MVGRSKHPDGHLAPSERYAAPEAKDPEQPDYVQQIKDSMGDSRPTESIKSL